jgi:hypothetical protein
MKKLLVLMALSLAGCDIQETFAPRPNMKIVATETTAGRVVLVATGEHFDRVEWQIEGAPNVLTGTQVTHTFPRNGIYSVTVTGFKKKRTNFTTNGVKVTTAPR